MFCLKCGEQIPENSTYCCYCGEKINIDSLECRYSQKKGKSLLEKLDDYTVIDIETTGRNSNTCDIIELAAVRVRNNVITNTFSTLVNPNKPLPYEIIKLTGITNQMVSSAPSLIECLNEFVLFIGNDVLLGHNISTFDLIAINVACSRVSKNFIINDYLDTLEYSHHCDIAVSDYKLSTLQDHFGIENHSQHRALADCIANHECYQRMKSLFEKTFYGYGVKRVEKQSHKMEVHYADDTNSLIQLKELLSEVSLDGKITEEEVVLLKNWLDKNRHLAGNYPFDIVCNGIEKALEDGILESEELDTLFNIFQEAFDPVNANAKKSTVPVDFNGKTVCLSGEFEFFNSKSEVESLLISKGATIKKNVVKSLNYLIVGGKGSDAWISGNYGTKVKKVLEWNEKGCSIEILKEDSIKNI